VVIDGLSPDAPELELSRLLDECRTAREERHAHTSNKAQAAAGLLVVGLQQRLLSSVEAFARSLAVHRRTVERHWEQGQADNAAGKEPDPPAGTGQASEHESPLPPFGSQPAGLPTRWNDRRVLIFTEDREGTKRYLKATGEPERTRLGRRPWTRSGRRARATRSWPTGAGWTAVSLRPPRGAASQGDRPIGRSVDRTSAAEWTAEGLRARSRDANARPAGTVPDRSARLGAARRHPRPPAGRGAARRRGTSAAARAAGRGAGRAGDAQVARAGRAGSTRSGRDAPPACQRILEELDRHEGQYKQIALAFDEEERGQSAPVEHALLADAPRPVRPRPGAGAGADPGGVRLFCVGGPERSRRSCERHGESYLTRRRRGEEGDGGGSLTGGAIPSA